MFRDLGDTSVRSSAAPSTGSMLGHVEISPVVTALVVDHQSPD
jgi:hypothetical protein